MGPDGLNPLSMREPHSVHQCEVEGNLTACAMTNQMELWYGDTKAAEFFEVYGHCRPVGIEPLLKEFNPLTRNVVRDEEASDPFLDVFEYRRHEYVIRVYVPSEWGDQRKSQNAERDCIPLSELEVSDPVWTDTSVST